jgi:hypothetical protein
MIMTDDLTEKVRHGLMSPWQAKLIRARRRREKAEKAERKAALAVTDNLTELVRDGTILPSAAIQIRADRARKAKEKAERGAEQQRWRERQEEEKRMAWEWAMFVLAHSPGKADTVLEHDPFYSLRQAVREVEEETGCKVGCGHRPLTPDEREQLITLMDQGVGDRGRLDREEAELLLDWAPNLVCDLPRVTYEPAAQGEQPTS